MRGPSEITVVAPLLLNFTALRPHWAMGERHVGVPTTTSYRRSYECVEPLVS